MDKILEFLNTTAFTLGSNEFSVMRLLLIPLVLLCGCLLIRWGDQLEHGRDDGQRLGACVP